MEHVTPSSIDDNHSNLSFPLVLQSDFYKRCGIAVHHAIEKIAWIETDRDREVAKNLLIEELQGLNLDDSAVDSITESLDLPEIAQIFTPGLFIKDKHDEIELHRELPFAIVCQNKLLSGCFDRLVVVKSPSGQKRIHIFDFKSGFSKESREKSLERHKQQLLAYKRAAEVLFSVDDSCIEATLVLLSLGSIISV